VLTLTKLSRGALARGFSFAAPLGGSGAPLHRVLRRLRLMVAGRRPALGKRPGGGSMRCVRPFAPRRRACRRRHIMPLRLALWVDRWSGRSPSPLSLSRRLSSPGWCSSYRLRCRRRWSNGLLEKAWQLATASAFGHDVDYRWNRSLCGPASIANILRSLGEPAGHREKGSCPYDKVLVPYRP